MERSGRQWRSGEDVASGRRRIQTGGGRSVDVVIAVETVVEGDEDGESNKPRDASQHLPKVFLPSFSSRKTSTRNCMILLC